MLSKDDVLAVAKLARLELSESELQKFQTQLENVLKLFDEVKDIDVANVSETSQITGLENIVRVDEVKYEADLKPSESEELLKNTPIKEGTNIVVPKIIESK